MPNVLAPHGFQARKNGIGSDWSSTLNTYKIASGYATNIFTRDIVKLLPTGTIALAAPADLMCGVAAGFKWTAANGKAEVSPFWPAGTVTLGGLPAEVMLHDDPNTTFEAQFTGAVVITQADVGATFASSSAGGSTFIGLSGMGVDSATALATAQQWRFLGFAPNPANDVTTANSYGLFVPALHAFRVNTGI